MTCTPNIPHGQRYQCFEQHRGCSKARREKLVATNRNWQSGSWHDCFHIPSQTIPIYPKAVWTTCFPGTFQQTMKVVLLSVKRQFPVAYFHYIFASLRTSEKQIVPDRSLLTLLTNAGVTLKFQNCRFFAKTVDYLGQIIHPRRLEIASHTTDSTRKFLTKLGSLSELCNVFWLFAPNITRIAAPLNKQSRKDQRAGFSPLH